MSQATTYIYSTGTKAALLEAQPRQTSDVEELRQCIRQLKMPKCSLHTNPPRVDYLDFYVLDDGSIEMEFIEQGDDVFARVDIGMAERVIEVAMTDTRCLSLRQKLDGLQIDWIT